MPAVTANVHSLAKALDAFATQAENMKSGKTVDYRIHHGMVGGRRVKGQEAHIVRLADGVYKLSWDESTGTTVSVAIKKRGRRSVPFQGSRGRGKNRLLHSSVSPQIQNFGRTQDRQYGWTWRSL